MIPFERKEKILDLLKKNNLLHLDKIHENLPEVSISTIRRDLKELEKEGRVILLHGGAVKLYSKSIDTPIITRGSRNSEAKKKIAEFAAEIVNDGDIVYVDSGSTNEEILRLLINKNVTIITSSSVLSSYPENIIAKVYSTGGELNVDNNSLVGEITIKTLELFNFDISFVGVNGVDLKSGYSTPSIAEAEKKRTVIKRSNKNYFVFDSSKYNKVYMSYITDIQNTKIITNKIDNQMKTSFAESHICE